MRFGSRFGSGLHSQLSETQNEAFTNAGNTRWFHRGNPWLLPRAGHTTHRCTPPSRRPRWIRTTGFPPSACAARRCRSSEPWRPRRSRGKSLNFFEDFLRSYHSPGTSVGIVHGNAALHDNRGIDDRRRDHQRTEHRWAFGQRPCGRRIDNRRTIHRRFHDRGVHDRRYSSVRRQSSTDDWMEGAEPALDDALRLLVTRILSRAGAGVLEEAAYRASPRRSSVLRTARPTGGFHSPRLRAVQA